MARASASTSDETDGVVDEGDHIAHSQKKARQHAQQDGASVGALALNGPQGWRVGRGGQAQQCSDVVGEYLGGHVDEQGVLAQARDGFEVHAAFEALEGLFDAPALVVQRAEVGGR